MAKERPHELAETPPKDPSAGRKPNLGVRLGLQPVRTRTRHDRLLECGAEPDNRPRYQSQSYWPSGVEVFHAPRRSALLLRHVPLVLWRSSAGPLSRPTYGVVRWLPLTRLCRDELAEGDDLEVGSDGHVLTDTGSHPLFVRIYCIHEVECAFGGWSVSPVADDAAAVFSNLGEGRVDQLDRGRRQHVGRALAR